MIENQKVNASMVGTDGNLSIIGSFQIIQNAITELMGLHKIDGFTLKDNYNAFWVFTKTRVRFMNKLSWGDEYVVNAFFSYVSLFKVNVDVEIKNSNNEIIAYSRTQLCVLDLTTQRIRKTSTVGVDDTIISSNIPMEIDFTTFENVDLPIIDSIQIKSTNIDFFHHTNNIEYIRLIMNTYSVKEIEEYPIKELEINYNSQSFENDILYIKKARFNGKDLIIFEKDDKSIIKCEIIY